jgi:alpha-beta hydrolase superfamily lysophospholipase
MLTLSILRIAVALLAVYLVAGAAVFLLQRSLIYPAPTAVGPLPRGYTTDDVDGVRVVMMHRAASAGLPTVLHFHGNAEQVRDTEHLAEAVAKHGVGFAAVEYPGYPHAGGTPSEKGIYQTAEAALKVLETRGVSSGDLILMGQSLGSGVATELAHRGRGRALVLAAPYTSMGDMAALAITWLPSRWLVRDRFDNASKASAIPIPVLILHGTRDSLIPIDMSRALAQRFGRATLVEIDGADHNDLWLVKQDAAYQALTTFTRSVPAADR